MPVLNEVASVRVGRQEPREVKCAKQQMARCSWSCRRERHREARHPGTGLQAGRTQSVGLGVPSGSPSPGPGCLLSTGPQARLRLRGLHLPCGHSRRCVGSESPKGPSLGLVQGQTRIRVPDTWAAAPGVSTADRSLWSARKGVVTAPDPVALLCSPSWKQGEPESKVWCLPHTAFLQSRCNVRS